MVTLVLEDERVEEMDSFPVNVCSPLTVDVTVDVPEFVVVKVRLGEGEEVAVDVPP